MTTCRGSTSPHSHGNFCVATRPTSKTTKHLCVRPPPTPNPRTVQRRPSAGVGGFRFAVDPRLPADRVAVFWRPEVLPSVIPLSSTHFATARSLDIDDLGHVIAERRSADGRHLIIRTAGGDLRLCLADPPDRPLAVVLPLDDDLPIRASAALQLWARIVRRSANPGQSLALTRQRRDRLVLMLRALDGHLTDASYREIAEVLFGAQRIERETWKTSSLRDRTIRLVRGGVALMRAGYQRLLRGA